MNFQFLTAIASNQAIYTLQSSGLDRLGVLETCLGLETQFLKSQSWSRSC